MSESITNPQTVVNIPLELIDPPAFNSRLGFDAEGGAVGKDPELPGLAKSMDADGLKQPITVETNGERYTMVFGSRRYRAAGLLKWATIPSIIVPTMASNIDRILANGVENLQRKDLSTYETARLCAKLRDEGLSLKDCADRLGFSVPKVSNYARPYNLLPDEIKKAWQEGHKAAAMEWLTDLSSIKGDTAEETKKIHLAAWADRLELQAQADSVLSAGDSDETDEEDEDVSDANGESKRAKPKDFKVTRDFYKFLMKALEDKRSVPGAALAAKVLDLAVGKVDAVRGLASRNDFEKAKELKKSNKDS